MITTFKYDVKIGIAGDNYSDVGDMTFEWDGEPGVTQLVIVEVYNNAACIALSYDGSMFGDDIEFYPDSPPQPVAFACRSVRIKNRDAGSNAIYQITGYWGE